MDQHVDLDEETTQDGWGYWMRVSGVLCGIYISRRVKGNVYKTAAIPVIVHGTDTLAVLWRKHNCKKVDVAYMRMSIKTLADVWRYKHKYHND